VEGSFPDVGLSLLLLVGRVLRNGFRLAVELLPGIIGGNRNVVLLSNRLTVQYQRGSH